MGGHLIGLAAMLIIEVLDSTQIVLMNRQACGILMTLGHISMTRWVEVKSDDTNQFSLHFCPSPTTKHPDA